MSAGEPVPVRSYYGRPVLKQPEWTWEVPWYLLVGGLGGTSSVLGALARASGNDALADRSADIAAIAAVASPVLLVSDLGRPSRFLHMLRVVKPTSAMSMGSWILAGYGATTTTARGLRAVRRLPRLRGLLEAGSAALGLGMSTYTAVLLADSSVPVWHEARGELPFVFAASAAASAGAAAILLVDPAEAGPARRLALGGAVVELASDELMQARLGELGEVYDEGQAGAYSKAAKTCTAAGAGFVALGGGARRGTRRWASVIGAGLLIAGSACQRWSVFQAGFASTSDPTHVVRPQRERLEQGAGHRSS